MTNELKLQPLRKIPYRYCVLSPTVLTLLPDVGLADPRISGAKHDRLL